MAISKIKLGNGTPIDLRDSASMHYIGYIAALPSSETLTITTDLVSNHKIAKNDYINVGTSNINYVCTAVTSEAVTWRSLSEAAAEIPVQDVTVAGTSVLNTSTHTAEIVKATAFNAATPKFGVVQTGANITNTDGVISVADATTAAKGVVKLSESIPASGADNTTVPTTLAVKTAIDNLPEPMVFKGTVGTGGTVDWTAAEPGDPALPSASEETVGYTYKVITEHATTPVCKIGDTIICAETSSNTYEWVVIPSGDEPSGTVTSVQAAAVANKGLVMGTGEAGASGDPISSSGTITVDVASGYEIPTTIKTGQWDTAYARTGGLSTTTAATGIEAGSDGSDFCVAELDGTDTEQLNIKLIHVNTATVATYTAPNP